MLLKPTQ